MLVSSPAPSSSSLRHLSTHIAMPMPPLMQSVARPFFALRFCISWSSVTTTRHASLPRPPKIPDQHNYPAADDIAICKPPKIPLLPEESKPHVVQHHCCSFWPCWGLLPRLFTCCCTLKIDPTEKLSPSTAAGDRTNPRVLRPFGNLEFSATSKLARSWSPGFLA